MDGRSNALPEEILWDTKRVSKIRFGGEGRVTLLLGITEVHKGDGRISVALQTAVTVVVL